MNKPKSKYAAHGEPETEAWIEVYAELREVAEQRHKIYAHAPELLNALETVPIHRLGETPEAFIERFKAWYRETRNPVITKAGSKK